MAKKQKTTKQKKKYYNNLGMLFEGCSYLSVLTPFFVIGIANYNEYFVEYDGTKVSIAFILAMAVMGFSIWGITKKKLENSFVVFIVKYMVIALIFTLLKQIMADISTIMWFGLIGLFVALGFNEGNKSMVKKRDRVKKSMEDAEDEANKQQYAEELRKKDE